MRWHEVDELAHIKDDLRIGAFKMREYTIRYQYGAYSGTRTIRLDDDDERNPIDVMWAQMRRRGELTLGMAHQSARIIDKKEFDEEVSL